MEGLTFGSLFSGIGGFDLGLERAGWKCAWQVEINPHCQRVLEKHWPDAPKYGDIREVTELEPVDLVCGGFPCQDFSVAGRRAGLAGQRSGLFYEFARIVRVLLPQWVVIENVPGLLSSNHGQDMAVVIGSLAQLRYGVSWRVLDAQYDGVAQRRRRVFIVGHLGTPWSASAKVLFEPESLSWDSAPNKGEGKNRIAPTISSSGAGTSRTGNSRTEAGSLIPMIAHSLTTREGQRMSAEETYIIQDTADTLTGNWHHSNGAKAGNNAGMINPVITHTLRSRGFDASEDGTGRGTPIIPAVVEEQTLIVRRSTPLETTRLMGFPDDWLDDLNLSDSKKYEMVGNAVVPAVVEWIGKRILKGGD